MHDIELLAIGSGIVYAIGRALQPSKPNQRETIRYVKRHTPQVPAIDRPVRLTTHRYPVRVPVDTVQPRNGTVQPSQRKTRAHRGTGPFGMSQEQLHTAQRYLRTGMDAPEYDGTPNTTGWIEGISEGETE